MKKKWTGERLETNIFSRDTTEHLHRYAVALEYIKDKTILDIACGEGYGSNLMSNEAKYVFGVDIDAETINKACKKYIKNNLKYLSGSTSNIPVQSNSIDVVISYETLEHHDEHEQMMLEIQRVLKPNGILIISTPDKHYYSDVRNFKNSFHVKELYKNEFLDLISKYFKFAQLLNQAHINGSSLISENEYIKKIKFFKGDYTEIVSIENDLTFLIIIASNAEFSKQNTTIFDGTEVAKHIVNEIKKEFTDSNTFRLGKFLLSPFVFIKRILK
ncbi:class I SAM-dependent methyltransferase [Flavobacterium sp. I-SCBP12n]|uniref:Class I SAM-dependent methyltransferase n=1 Tax=Flavobacterium pygoscelis TaxID=2893176 RepID=A0A9X1XYE4_9FLAO|nr:class I SAM-dependent methyltransferase [Flavobacterium pygoscelis]MCK8141927.1 class I SAM-dependent methyltransferase [Flavobacterium pygoscelis]